MKSYIAIFTGYSQEVLVMARAFFRKFSHDFKFLQSSVINLGAFSTILLRNLIKIIKKELVVFHCVIIFTHNVEAFGLDGK